MSNEFHVAKSVQELELLFNVKAGPWQRYNYNMERVPAAFGFLKPYVDFFCIKNQSSREDFYSKLPEEAFYELKRILDDIGNELIDWLGGEEARVKPLSDEYIALSILSLLPEEYLPAPSPFQKLTDKQKANVSYLLSLTTSQLADYWALPKDTFARIDVDVTKIPDKFKSLSPLLNLVSVEDESERTAFLFKVPISAINDIKEILASFGNDLIVWLTIDIITSPVTNEILALDLLRMMPVDYELLHKK